MAKEEFVQNVRDAAALVAPVVETGGPAPDQDPLGRALRRAVLWLTPKAVSGFDPDDFKDLDPDRRRRLQTAVREFRSVAAKVSPEAPATAEQVRTGWSKFQDVVAIVQQPVREEWLGEVDRLITEAAAWCRKSNWLAKIRGKKVRDRFLGEYEVPQLQIHTLESRLLLDPVARYAPGTSGLLDLAVLPSYESVMVTRTHGKWYIHPVQDQGRRREWSERAFVDTVTRLSALA